MFVCLAVDGEGTFWGGHHVVKTSQKVPCVLQVLSPVFSVWKEEHLVSASAREALLSWKPRNKLIHC